jgi:hypothetical protein
VSDRIDYSDGQAPHIRRALDALDAIPGDWADVSVTREGWIVVVPYWAPEVVDPDGRPIGTAREHRAQWERVVEALDDAGWEPHYPAETPVQRMGRLLAELGDRLHGGWPVAFRHVGGEE